MGDIERCPHVVLTRSVRLDRLSKNGVDRLERRLAAEQPPDKRYEKHARRNHRRNRISRQAKAVLADARNDARPEEQRLSRKHGNVIEMEPCSGPFEGRADEIVVSDGSPANRHEDVCAIRTLQGGSEGLMRIASNPENARLSARGFDHCGESKGI